MKDIFDNMLLESGLIVPLKTDIRDLLYEACDKYVSSDTFYLGEFDELSIHYINNEPNNKLDRYVSEYVQQEYEERITLPACVRHALVFFTLYRSIMNPRDEEDAALYSLSLQNTLILAKNHTSELKYKMYLTKLFYHFDEYCKDIISNPETYPRELIKKVFAEDEFSISDLEDNDTDGIKYMAYVSWAYGLEKYIANVKEDNPYIRAALCLKYYFNNLPSYRMYITLDDLMEHCCMKSTKHPKLRKVMKDIEDTGLVFTDHRSSASCVLMNILYDQSANTANGTYLNEYFNVKEFFVYLYNELMLDYKLNENGYYED